MTEMINEAAPAWADQHSRIGLMRRQINEGLRIMEALYPGMDVEWRADWLSGYLAPSLLGVDAAKRAYAPDMNPARWSFSEMELRALLDELEGEDR